MNTLEGGKEVGYSFIALGLMGNLAVGSVTLRGWVELLPPNVSAVVMSIFWMSGLFCLILCPLIVLFQLIFVERSRRNWSFITINLIGTAIGLFSPLIWWIWQGDN